MRFENWTRLAAIEADKGNTGAAVACVASALEALAAERALARMTPRFEGPVQGFERGPVSYSHWGMFA